MDEKQRKEFVVEDHLFTLETIRHCDCYRSIIYDDKDSVIYDSDNFINGSINPMDLSTAEAVVQIELKDRSGQLLKELEQTTIECRAQSIAVQDGQETTWNKILERITKKM